MHYFWLSSSEYHRQARAHVRSISEIRNLYCYFCIIVLVKNTSVWRCREARAAIVERPQATAVTLRPNAVLMEQCRRLRYRCRPLRPEMAMPSVPDILIHSIHNGTKQFKLGSKRKCIDYLRQYSRLLALTLRRMWYQSETLECRGKVHRRR